MEHIMWKARRTTREAKKTGTKWYGTAQYRMTWKN